MIDLDIEVLILKLLFNPDDFTVKQLRDLEGKLDLFNKAKSMGLDTSLIDDQIMVEA